MHNTMINCLLFQFRDHHGDDLGVLSSPTLRHVLEPLFLYLSLQPAEEEFNCIKLWLVSWTEEDIY